MVAIIGGIVSSYGATASGMVTTCSVVGSSVGAVAGIGYGIAESARALTTGVLMAKSAAGGAVASAILGPIVAGAIGSGSKTFAAAAVSSLAGAASGAGAAALTASAVTAGLLASPIGSTLLGAKEASGVYTYDCWKPVLHDESTEPSKGRLLREVASDPRIRHVTAVLGAKSEFPCLVLHNIWDEKFLIDFLYLPSGQLAAHAVNV
uniref:Uncharacterized protein n=1 Tax=Plectus sambesii TaxID=2011161 RepID=A0A914WZ56_9BILA